MSVKRFDWDTAPAGQAYRRRFGDGWEYYVMASDRAVFYSRFHQVWRPCVTSESERRIRQADPVYEPVQRPDSLHPLVPGQEAIDWADELLRDPEVAGWTEAWIYDCLSGSSDEQRFILSIRTANDIGRSRHTHGTGWRNDTTAGRSFCDVPYRSATTDTKKEQEREETVTTETETLEEFKARVYKVGKAAAKEHGWCSVFDGLMDELGIEPPKIEWPKPSTLFRAPSVWVGDTIGIVLNDGKYRFARDCGELSDDPNAAWDLAEDIESLDNMKILDA